MTLRKWQLVVLAPFYVIGGGFDGLVAGAKAAVARLREAWANA